MRLSSYVRVPFAWASTHSDWRYVCKVIVRVLYVLLVFGCEWRFFFFLQWFACFLVKSLFILNRISSTRYNVEINDSHNWREQRTLIVCVRVLAPKSFRFFHILTAEKHEKKLLKWIMRKNRQLKSIQIEIVSHTKYDTNDQFMPIKWCVHCRISAINWRAKIEFSSQSNWHETDFSEKFYTLRRQFSEATSEKRPPTTNIDDDNVNVYLQKLKSSLMFTTPTRNTEKKSHTILLPLFAIAFMKIYGHFFPPLVHCEKLTQCWN